MAYQGPDRRRRGDDDFEGIFKRLFREGTHVDALELREADQQALIIRARLKARLLQIANIAEPTDGPRVKLASEVTPAKVALLLANLKSRFLAYPKCSEGMRWDNFEEALSAAPQSYRGALLRMESFGGEPRVVSEDLRSFTLMDCGPEKSIFVLQNQHVIDLAFINNAETRLRELGLQILSPADYNLLNLKMDGNAENQDGKVVIPYPKWPSFDTENRTFLVMDGYSIENARQTFLGWENGGSWGQTQISHHRVFAKIDKNRTEPFLVRFKLTIPKP